MAEDKILFEVVSKLGKKVRITKGNTGRGLHLLSILE